MFWFDLFRIQLNTWLIEVSIGEIRTNINAARPLIGLGWHRDHGFRIGLLFLQKWDLPLWTGLSLFAIRYHRGWQAALFGRFSLRPVVWSHLSRR